MAGVLKKIIPLIPPLEEGEIGLSPPFEKGGKGDLIGDVQMESRKGGKMVRSTTVLCVRRHDKVAIAGDGQVTVGSTVMKQNAKKIRRMYNGTLLAGFAGGAADALTPFERFEGELEQPHVNLIPSA